MLASTPWVRSAIHQPTLLLVGACSIALACSGAHNNDSGNAATSGGNTENTSSSSGGTSSSSGSGATTELIFSEYIEGSRNNKALEIFNGTDESKDLSSYTIQLFTNGAATATSTFTLSGSLGPGQVHVVCNASADAALLGLCNDTSNVCGFNGNDTVTLMRGSSQVDRIGDLTDPSGGAWGTTVTTQNATLRRKCSVQSGVTSTQQGGFDPAAEWNAFPVDDFSNLGAPSCTGGGSSSSSTSSPSSTSSTSQSSSHSSSSSVSSSVSSSSSSSVSSSSSSSSSGGGVWQPWTASKEQLCNTYASRVCNKFASCHLMDFYDVYVDFDDCNAAAALQCKMMLTAPGSTATETNVGTCNNTVAALTCSEFLDRRRGAVCDFPMPASEPTTCVADTQCRSLRCQRYRSPCGSCFPQGAGGVGTTCYADDSCAVGLQCAAPVAFPPEQGTCQPGGDVNSGCDDATAPCKSPLLCQGGSCAMGIPSGQSCDFGSCDWSAGLVCDRDLNDNHVCQQYAFVPPGSSCRPFSDGFQPTHCTGGSECDVPSGTTNNGYCAGVGSSCSGGDRCRISQSCDAQQSCVEPDPQAQCSN